MRKFLWIVLLISVCQSCRLYPPYHRPELGLPLEWKYDANDETTDINFRWWREFGDSVLDDLICEALDYNRDLKVAICRVFEFAAQLQITRSQLYPQVNATGLAIREESSLALTPILVELTRVNNDFNLLANVSWELDLWGKIRSASDADLARVFASIEARRGVVLTIVTAVAATYLQLRQFDAQLEVSRKTLQSRIEAYDLAVIRYKGGLISEMEVYQADSEVQDAKAQVINFELQVQQQENLLSVLVGRYPDCIERGLTLDELEVPECVPAGFPCELIEQRPDVLEAEQLLIAANAEIGAALAQYYPDITLRGYYGYESRQLHNLFSSQARTWLYGGSFSEPIFTGGRIEGDVNLTKAVRCETKYHYEQTVLNAVKEVDDALIAHQKAQELVIVQKKRVDVLTQYLDLAWLRYYNGLTDYLNVLDAQRNLFRAQLDYAQAQGLTLITIVDLYKALGGGWVLDADEGLPIPDADGNTI